MAAARARPRAVGARDRLVLVRAAAVGKTMFCRAYGANYVYGAAIQLWFLVPLRLRVRATPARIALFGIAGVVAGLCNEHTGPVLCLGLALWAWRSRDRLAIAGAAGAIVGFAAIFFAPGQGERYEGLAQRRRWSAACSSAP